MIFRARTVATMDGPPIPNGAVVTEGGEIVDVGSFNDVRARNAGPMTDLGEQVLLPGLINAHCHLDYTCLRGKIRGATSFAGWIEAINAEKAKLSPEDYVRSIDEGFVEARKFGTTAMVNLTAFPELIEKVSPSLQTFWFAELIDVRNPESANEMVDRAVAGVGDAAVKNSREWGLAPHAPFTASAQLYRHCGDVAPLLTTHVAESRDEMSMFRDASGALYDFLKGIGRDMSDCGGTTPFREVVSRLDESEAPCLMAHLNEIDESDFPLLKETVGRFHVAHCPRSHAYFKHAPFAFRRLRDLGANICLGTDSLASNDDLNLFAEMREFQRRFSDVSPEEILRMVTRNPAKALQAEGRLGVIREGARADLITLGQTAPDIFAEIIAFEGFPRGVIPHGPADD